MGSRVVIVGAGFAGLNCAKRLANVDAIDVTLVDRENHHVFQPLLYQVATAALSPAEIAAPIRGILSSALNVRVLMAEAERVELATRILHTGAGPLAFDYLVLAGGATHAFFGRNDWEPHAPGLKTLSQATEIRGRILRAFEFAESATDPAVQRQLLTFVVVGGGPTGVELAGALGEMSRYTLARDFRRIDPRLARVVLVEAGPRILPAFSAASAARAVRDLEALGVQVWTNSPVTAIEANSVAIGDERLKAGTVLWAAGVRAAPIAGTLGLELDRAGRVPVTGELVLPTDNRIYVLGDMARTVPAGSDAPLPGTADVAMQQGLYAGRAIVGDTRGEARAPFRLRDWGHFATVGRGRALFERGRFRLTRYPAWWFWLLLHIYRLTGFRSRALVLIQWAWSYFTYGRGARLIVRREWRQFPD